MIGDSTVSLLDDPTFAVILWIALAVILALYLLYRRKEKMGNR
ncbi:MAG TPA: hypothetical protein VLE03_06680 [Nitrospiraceae bacterium]|nr:hypothetical protein [Nitrospiraceae bacterium]